MVGPFCFLDHMGPVLANKSGELDVLAHPHIGLATLTYLFSGSLLHRDSLGTEKIIESGDVNLMVAGKGIVHSERVLSAAQVEAQYLHGLQSWIALPKELEDCEPTFQHFPVKDLPRFQWKSLKVHLLLGEFEGQKSPVTFPWKSLYCNLQAEAGSQITFTGTEEEQAFYLVSGKVDIDSQQFSEPILIYFKKGEVLKIHFLASCHLMLLGGDKLPEERFMFWNFVSTSPHKLEAAKIAWIEQRFPKVPGETEFVPLPAN